MTMTTTVVMVVVVIFLLVMLVMVMLVSVVVVTVVVMVIMVMMMIVMVVIVFGTFRSCKLFGQLLFSFDGDGDLATRISVHRVRSSSVLRSYSFGAALIAISCQVQDRLVLEVVADPDGEFGNEHTWLRGKRC